MFRIKRPIDWYTWFPYFLTLKFWQKLVQWRHILVPKQVFHPKFACIPLIFKIYTKILTKKTIWGFLPQFLPIPPPASRLFVCTFDKNISSAEVRRIHPTIHILYLLFVIFKLLMLKIPLFCFLLILTFLSSESDTVW